MWEHPAFFSMNMPHAGHFLPILAMSARVAGSSADVATLHTCERTSAAGTSALQREHTSPPHGQRPRRTATPTPTSANSPRRTPSEGGGVYDGCSS